MGRRRLLWAYGLVLLASHLTWRAVSSEPEPQGDQQQVLVHEYDRGERTGELLRVVLRDLGPRQAPPVVLLHGNPGGLEDFDALAPLLEGELRLIVPDLPGFGRSRQALADYSIEAQGHAVLGVLDALGLESAHVVGFSLGSGAALHAADRAPTRVRSLTLLSGIGVQEFQMFGTYELNHALHALQLFGIQLLRLGLPHFGALEQSPLGLAYARTFFDSDQRPLRELFSRYDGPMLIVHGAEDFLVPPATAQEHRRLVPQSELLMLEGEGHFLPWTWTEGLAAALREFVREVEAGRATTRAEASHERLQAAARPFDPTHVPAASGITVVVAILLLAAATLVSEDLTCIAAGLLVAQGRLDFFPASLGCFIGIFVGDVGLFAMGRYLGTPALRYAPLKWIVSRNALERARRWFESRGLSAIFISRFMPGLRLPTYLAAGVVGTRLGTFAAWFAFADLIWTPMLVGLSAWAGVQAGDALGLFEEHALAGLLALLAVLLLVQRLIVPLLTWRGRRGLVGAWRRWTRWEFWPPWCFYPPVVLWIGWLSLRHGGFSKVTAVNPGIETGGFLGESKSAILKALGDGHPDVARFCTLAADESLEDRRARAEEFMTTLTTRFPIVLKPDVGQRGSGVQVIADEQGLCAALETMRVDCMLQEHVGGAEYGLFYVKRPGVLRGELFSLAEKRLPEVVGDGQRTLERLILEDARAVAMARVYLDENVERLLEVPTPGERVQLIQVGAHCRGAIFLDAGALVTDELTQALERLSQGFEGFHFGRYDVRGAGPQELSRGVGFKVIELNGLTSEPGHVYDPRHSLFHAWQVHCRQWSLAFEIAAANIHAGARPVSLVRLLREVLRYRRLRRGHA